MESNDKEPEVPELELASHRNKAKRAGALIVIGVMFICFGFLEGGTWALGGMFGGLVLIFAGMLLLMLNTIKQVEDEKKIKETKAE